MVAQELLDLVEQVDGLLEIDRAAGVVVHLVDDLLELLDRTSVDLILLDLMIPLALMKAIPRMMDKC